MEQIPGVTPAGAVTENPAQLEPDGAFTIAVGVGQGEALRVVGELKDFVTFRHAVEEAVGYPVRFSFSLRMDREPGDVRYADRDKVLAAGRRIAERDAELLRLLAE